MLTSMIIFLFVISIAESLQHFDMNVECATIGGVMIDIFPYSCFKKTPNTQVDLKLLAAEHCIEMDDRYTIGHLPWLATTAQTFAMMDALPWFNYATSGMFQINNDDEPGGNWYFVGKDAHDGLFGPLPNQVYGSLLIHRSEIICGEGELRFDIWRKEQEPTDMLAAAGHSCEGLHDDTTCMIGGTSYDNYTKSYTYPGMCNKNGYTAYIYAQAICQYDYRFARQIFLRNRERGMLKDIVGVRSIPNIELALKCGNECSAAPICSMYSFDTATNMCRLSFVPIDFIDTITQLPNNYQNLYVRTLL